MFSSLRFVIPGVLFLALGVVWFYRENLIIILEIVVESRSELEWPDWYSKVEETVTWSEFQKADEPVEMVPIRFEHDIWVTARVAKFSTGPGETRLSYVLGVRNPDSFHDVRFQGPKVTFTAARHVPIPAEVMEGKVIYLQYDFMTGEMLTITLDLIGVSHIRKSDGENCEILGLLNTAESSDFFQASPEEQEEMSEAFPLVAIQPDKIHLEKKPQRGLDFQNLRIVRDFGICIQTVEAGMGMVELEPVSLQELSEPQPWISLKDVGGWELLPLGQRTGQAG